MRNLLSLVLLALPWCGRNLSSLFLTSLACPPVTAMTRLIPLTSWRSLMMARSSTDPVWRRCLKSQQRIGKKAHCSSQTEIKKFAFFLESSKVQQLFPNPNTLTPFPSLKSRWYPVRQEIAGLRLLQSNLCATCPAGSSQMVQPGSVLLSSPSAVRWIGIFLTYSAATPPLFCQASSQPGQ